jgi:hypothetical protein
MSNLLSPAGDPECVEFVGSVQPVQDVQLVCETAEGEQKHTRGELNISAEPGNQKKVDRVDKLDANSRGMPS